MIENHSPHLYKALELIVRSFRNDAIEVLWIKNDSATTETDVVKQYPALSGKNNLTTVQLEHSQLQQVVADRNMTFDYAIMSRNESADSLNEIFKQLRCPIILVSWSPIDCPTRLCMPIREQELKKSATTGEIFSPKSVKMQLCRTHHTFTSFTEHSLVFLWKLLLSIPVA